MAEKDYYIEGDFLYAGKQKYRNTDFEAISDRFNVRIKHYPDGRYAKSIADRPVYRIKSIKQRRPRDDFSEDELEENRKRSAKRNDNLNRARQRVYDLIQVNKQYMQLFVTITFNPAEVDSTNVQEVSKKLYKWLNNRVQRKGLRYILLPEYHKSGRIHMHMLCNDVLGKVDSGTREVLGFDRPLKLETIARLQIPPDRVKGTVYNLTEWKYGFSTAIYTYGDILRLVNYVQKYMVKGQQQIFGRYFWYSKNMELYPELELRNEWGAFASSFSPVRENSAGMRFKFENHNTLKEE